MKKGTLYLVPNLLGGGNYDYCLPHNYGTILSNIHFFIVEDIRNARRFLKYGHYISSFDDVVFLLLNKHTQAETYSSFLLEAEKGHDIAMISEAGCPCIADPGAIIVEMAHHKNINVKPLVGPSSIILALMASGFNGQNFCFNGYIPIKPYERQKKIKELEKKALHDKQTQIFIETPYRNQKLFEDILNTAHHNTKLCLACNLTLDDESIKTHTIAEWKRIKIDINKKQLVFLISV